jgi:NAD+ kinase
MRIGLFFNGEIAACAEVAAKIQSAFAGDSNVEFVTGNSDSDHGDINCAVSIGGDGTFLLTARTIMGLGVPLYGVNMGRLGFLASGDAGSAAGDIRRIVAGEYGIHPMIPLKAEITKDSEKTTSWAFNEIMIAKNFVSRPIALSTYLSGEKLYSFLADGIILSTPTGSTAYALSAGGPIIHPGVNCVSIVPICAHSLSPRPMLVPCDADIMIKLDYAQEGALLSGDGHDGGGLASGNRVLVTSDFDSRVDVIKMDGGSYADVLRDKLNWS